jgi:hypothetical protein
VSQHEFDQKKEHEMRRVSLGMCLPLAVLFALPVARANWSGSYTNDNHFVVNYSQVPDFDQRRNTLPNNGSMYCAPTSSMNWMAYIASHGYPNLPPYPHDWQSQSNYDLATIEIFAMGLNMGTDPVDGTGGSGAMSGIVGWLPDGFLVIHEYADGFYAPQFITMAKLALARCLVIPVVGWYQGSPPNISRNGGHVLTLTKAVSSGGNMQIGWRDPADDSADLGTQSTFVTQTYAIDPQLVVVDGYLRVMDKVVNYGSAYLDEFFAILPLFGLTTTTDHRHISVLHPILLGNDRTPLYTYLPSGNGAPIRDLTLYAAGLDYYYITAPEGSTPSQVWKLDPVSQQSTSIASLADAQRLVFGRNRELYVLDGRTLHRFNLDVDPPEETHVVPDSQIDALVYNDSSDVLLALSMNSMQIIRFDPNLRGLPAIQIPPGPVLGGESSITVRPADESVFFTSTGSPVIYHLTHNGHGGFDLSSFGDGSVSHPRGLNINSNTGHVYVACDGVLQEFMEDPFAGWQEVSGSAFAGLTVGNALHIPRNRTNFDPNRMVGPAYYNVLPTEFAPGVPDLPGDVNCDGAVNNFDITPFVIALTRGEVGYYDAYPTCNWLNADVNGDGSADNFDITPFVRLLAGG